MRLSLQMVCGLLLRPTDYTEHINEKVVRQGVRFIVLIWEA